jgi:hypothetical protein
MAEKDRTRFEIVKAPEHPLGWKCEDCVHVVKDPTPGSVQMKCVRYPPNVQFVNMGNGGPQMMSISPPVQLGQWCGEFTSGDIVD